MKKVILLLALAVGVTVNAVASEPIKFGVRAGLNVANIGGDGSSPDSRIGFHVGGVADISLASLSSASIMQYLYFQPSLLITTKGWTSGSEIKARPTYLELPLMLSGAYPINNDIKIRANVGPYLALGLLGKVKDNALSDDSHNMFGNDNKWFKRFDAGLGFGAGVDYKQYYLGINYDLGLYNVWNVPGVNAAVKNRCFMISLGYNF